MSLLHYVDFEVPDFAEVNVYEFGSSTCEQLTAAAFPERGSYGARVTVSGATTDTAYFSKEISERPTPGGDMYFGFWFNCRAFPGVDSTRMFYLHAGSSTVARVYFKPDRTMYLQLYDDASGNHGVGYFATGISIGRWNYVVVHIKRAATSISADGAGDVYVNGQLRGSITGVDNFDRCDDGDAIGTFGAVSVARNGWIADFDEVKIATTYPQPYAPTPASDYLCPQRLCVLYREASADSVAFADYCVSQLGVPRANLIALPNASAGETLASYATWRTEIGDDLDAMLALHSLVADNCTCLLAGYGVPGYFTDAGVTCSTADRLMRTGQAFAAKTANPLYQATTRPTAAALAAAGLHTACRIDADSLAHAEALIDRAATVAGLAKIAANDYLATDDADLAASLTVQHTRLATALNATPESSSFVIGDDIPTLAPIMPTAGARVGVCQLATEALATMRAGVSRAAGYILTGSYAAAFGFSDLAATAEQGFDAEVFLDRLRQGWTFAEAVLASVQYVDYCAVPVGSPLMTVAFELGGYNLYRGDSRETIDWDTPVAYARPGTSQFDMQLPLLVGQRHVLAIRAVSQAGIEEASRDVLTYVEIDGQGMLTAAPPAMVEQLTADPLADDELLVGFTCRRQPGRQMPTAFDILTDHGAGPLDLDNPLATITVVDSNQADYQTVVSLGSLPAGLAVRPRAGDTLGSASAVIVVRPTSQPSPPAIF